MEWAAWVAADSTRRAADRVAGDAADPAVDSEVPVAVAEEAGVEGEGAVVRTSATSVTAAADADPTASWRASETGAAIARLTPDRYR